MQNLKLTEKEKESLNRVFMMGIDTIEMRIETQERSIPRLSNDARFLVQKHVDETKVSMERARRAMKKLRLKVPPKILSACTLCEKENPDGYNMKCAECEHQYNKMGKVGGL